jgi:hypothetical protein
VTRGPGASGISIAMATYNGERYLAEMLASLGAQSRLPDELVVRDDGSTDGTLDLLDDFAGRAGFPVRILAGGEQGGEHLGYAQNFVTVARECTGDLIFFADQDDVWHDDKLATVSAAAPTGEPAALFHDVALTDAAGAVLAPSLYAVLAERGFDPVASLKGCSLAVTREFVELWGWPGAESAVPHDVWVAILSTAFDQRRTLTSVLIDHRLHEANASGWIPDDGSRSVTSRGDGSTDVEVLVDLLVKRRRLGRRTRGLLEVARERGNDVDPVAARHLRQTLRANRRRLRGSAPDEAPS